MPASVNVTWEELVQHLGISGFARQLAQHCEMTRLDATQIDLSIPKAQEHLLAGANQGRLKAALQQRYGAAFKVNIVVANVAASEVNSPATIASREQEAQKARARRDIDADPFVQELKKDFGARVRDVRPNG